MSGPGSYCAVGLGMMLGAHLSPRCRSEIEQADVVFGLVSDAIVELWLAQLRPDVRSLQPFYAEGKRRTDSYREMIDPKASRRRCTPASPRRTASTPTSASIRAPAAASISRPAR
jgi:hypothetical protein